MQGKSLNAIVDIWIFRLNDPERAFQMVRESFIERLSGRRK